jgi:antitoxin FitA
MASQLLVRNLEDEVVEALKKRAAKHGRSVEEEHRRILRRVLCPKKPKQSLLEMIRTMPKFDGDDDLFDIPRKVDSRPDPFEGA